MTIKRRLFISNIIMIVLPIILTMAMGITAILVFLNITNTRISSFWENWVTYVSEEKAGEMLRAYEDIRAVDEVAVYKSESQGYFMVFPDGESVPHNSRPLAENDLIPLLFIISLVIIVYMTNRALTRHIFRNIMSPIHTLVNGVHELRDGNLTYRIDYPNQDEFSAVCSDFNEMASRLLDMVNERQKDERSRKELLAGISHDLRTPLTSIKSYVKGLRDGIARNPEREREYLEVIYRKTCDMEGLIDQLFLFTKLETESFPFHMQSVSIHEYIAALMDSLDYDLRDNHALIAFTSSCERQRVLLDGEQMNRAVTNILYNSVKHNKGEEIRIDAALYQEGDHIVMRFKDNGRGVTEQELSRLFDFFYRGDEARSDPSSGSGLGLSIAKKIVDAHGGRITAENADGLAIAIALPLETEE